MQSRQPVHSESLDVHADAYYTRKLHALYMSVFETLFTGLFTYRARSVSGLAAKRCDYNATDHMRPLCVRNACAMRSQCPSSSSLDYVLYVIYTYSLSNCTLQGVDSYGVIRSMPVCTDHTRSEAIRAGLLNRRGAASHNRPDRVTF